MRHSTQSPGGETLSQHSRQVARHYLNTVDRWRDTISTQSTRWRDTILTQPPGGETLSQHSRQVARHYLNHDLVARLDITLKQSSGGRTLKTVARWRDTLNTFDRRCDAISMLSPDGATLSTLSTDAVILSQRSHQMARHYSKNVSKSFNSIRHNSFM